MQRKWTILKRLDLNKTQLAKLRIHYRTFFLFLLTYTRIQTFTTQLVLNKLVLKLVFDYLFPTRCPCYVVLVMHIRVPMSTSSLSCSCCTRSAEVNTLDFSNEGTLEKIHRPNNFTFASFVRCQRKICLTCDSCINNDINNTIKSNTTHSHFAVNRRSYTCTDKNVIYMIQCKRCNIQYVGETTQKIKTRFMQHRYKVKTNQCNTYLYKHFNTMNHSVDDMKLVILDQTRTHTKSKSILLNMEYSWIQALNTIYPFGLNDNIKKVGNISTIFKDNDFNFKNIPYFQLKITNNCRRRSRKKRHRSRVLDDNILQNLDTLYQDNKMRDIYLYLRKSSKRTLKKAFILSEASNINVNIRLIILGYYCGFYSNKEDIKKAKKEVTCTPFPFYSKSIDNLNLNTKINRLYKSSIKKAIINFQEISFRKIQLVFKYGKTIGQYLFNYL